MNRSEEAASAISDYVAAKYRNPGIHYSLDINKAGANPFLLMGPTNSQGIRIMYDMLHDAAISACFRIPVATVHVGSECVGVSVEIPSGSHAAYNFKNHRALIVGNDTNTWPIRFGFKRMSQVKFIYPKWLCYLLEGHSVIHIVWPICDHLMALELDPENKVRIDSKGWSIWWFWSKQKTQLLLPERLFLLVSAHIDNIIAPWSIPWCGNHYHNG